MPSSTTLLSGSDDSTLRIWDIPTATPLAQFNQHSDYIRAAIPTANPHLVYSGSYDSTIHLVDTRSNSSVLKIEAGGPVSSLCLISENILAAATENTIKIYDILSSGRLLTSLSNHTKTITALATSTGYLYSGALDAHVKIYSTSDFTVKKSTKFVSPVHSLGVSANASVLAVGMSDGTLSIRSRLTTLTTKKTEQEQILRNGTSKYFLRGSISTPADIVIPHEKKQKLKTHDKLLKKFEYKKCLDHILTTNKTALLIYTVMKEMHSRCALEIALANRDEHSLEPILRYLLKYVTYPKFSRFLVHVTEKVLDLYSSLISKSVLLEDLVEKLRMKIREEIQVQKQVSSVLGMLDLIFSASIRE